MKRFLRTNSRAESFSAFKEKHKHNLRKRGYPNTFINKYTNKVRFLDRSYELKTTTKVDKKKRLAFITRYTPSATKAIEIIHKLWPSLQKTKWFKNKTIPRPMLAFRGNKNIRSYLVRAKLPSRESQTKVPIQIEFPLNFTSDLNP